MEASSIRLSTELLGAHLTINGRRVVEQPLQVHSNDGSAQYHVALPGLPAGVFELRASLWLDPESDAVTTDAVSFVEVLTAVPNDDEESRTVPSEITAGGGWDLSSDDEVGWEALIGGCNAVQLTDAREESDKGAPDTCLFGGVWRPGPGGQGGACDCKGARFGERCEADAFADSQYTPREAPARTRWGCVAAARWRQRARRVVQRISALHEGAEACRNATGERGGPGGLRASLEGKALGAQMHFAALALSAALVRGRPLLIEDSAWAYGQHAACGGRGRRCFFQPLLSACDSSRLLADLAAGGAAGEPLSSARDVRDGLLPPADEERGGAGQAGRGGGGSGAGTVLLHRSALLAYLLRPSRDFAARLARMRALLGWGAWDGAGGGVLGVHVRRGDSCLHAAMSASRPLCLPLEAYRASVAEMVARYSPAAVFLATDDPHAVESMRAAVAGMVRSGGGGAPRFLVQEFDRSVFASKLFIEHAFEAGLVDPGAVAERTLTDLALLADCDFLVGGLAPPTPARRALFAAAPADASARLRSARFRPRVAALTARSRTGS